MLHISEPKLTRSSLSTNRDLMPEPPNKRLKLAARVD